MKKTLFLTALVALSPALLWAQEGGGQGGPGRMEERFKAADKDGDGQLTKEEAQAGMPRIAEHFDEIDANKDGKISLDEIRAAREKMRGPGGPAPQQ